MDEKRLQGKTEMSDFRTIFTGRNDRLALPRSDKARIDSYVAHQSVARGSVENVPFRRQVDFWAFAIGTALAMKLEPRSDPVSQWGYGFIYTSQGILDDDLCSLLVVVATAKLGYDNSEVDKPGKIIELANRLAGAGCPVVLEKLAENSLRTTPLDQVITFARQLQRSILDE